MDIIFKEYCKVIWQKKGYFLLALLALGSSITLDLSAPVYYKNIANGLALPYSEATLTSSLTFFLACPYPVPRDQIN